MAYYKKIILIILPIMIIFLLNTYSYSTDVTFENNNQEVTITDINNPYSGLAIFYNTDYAVGSAPPRYFFVSWDSPTVKFGIDIEYQHNMRSSGGNFYYTTNKSSFSQQASMGGFSGIFKLVYTNTDIYDYYNMNNVIIEGTPSYNNPAIYNKNDISQANFESVVVLINDYEITDNLYLTTIYNPIDTGVTGSGDTAYYYSAYSVELNYSSKYYVDNYNEQSIYIVPKSDLNLLPNTQYFLVLGTESKMFYNTLGVYNYQEDPTAIDCVSFNTGQTITSQDVTNNELNNQTDSINNQTNAINNQTNSINNINNTLTDDSVTASAEDLPSINVNDPTSNGINNIFNSIYVAFCEGEPQNIIFPIPFTNKNIILDPYYLEDMLVSYGLTWVLIFIQAFWGYLIGRFIVKDISKKITKIKSGNIENLQNDNIKEDML